MNKAETKGQQGDVLMKRLDALPEGERKVVAKGRCIVRHGESGHAHVIDALETDAELIQIGERMLVVLHKETALHHVPTPKGNEPLSLCGEHASEVYPAGVWEVGQVREFDHFAQQERRVVD